MTKARDKGPLRHKFKPPFVVYVCANACPTCPFIEGNPVDLKMNRVPDLAQNAVIKPGNPGNVPCQENKAAICAEFFDRHSHQVFDLDLFNRLGQIERVGHE